MTHSCTRGACPARLCVAPTLSLVCCVTCTSSPADACMNVAALVSGPATDMFRYLFKDGITMFGFHMSSLRALFLTGVLTSLLQALVAGCGMREINVNASGQVRLRVCGLRAHVCVSIAVGLLHATG